MIYEQVITVPLSTMMAIAAKEHRDKHDGCHAQEFRLSQWCWRKLCDEVRSTHEGASLQFATPKWHGAHVVVMGSHTDHRFVPAVILVDRCGVQHEV